MAENKKYKVIISDRAKRMLGTHIRFMAQVNKQAASEKKKEIMTAMRSLSQMPQRFPFFEELYITPNKLTCQVTTQIEPFVVLPVVLSVLGIDKAASLLFKYLVATHILYTILKINKFYKIFIFDIDRSIYQ